MTSTKMTLYLTAYATQFNTSDIYNTGGTFNLQKMKISKVFFRPINTYRNISFNVQTNDNNVNLNMGQYYNGVVIPSVSQSDSTRYMKNIIIGDAGTNNVITYLNENNNYWDYISNQSSTLSQLTVSVAFDGVYPTTNCDITADNPMIIEIEFI